MFTGHYFFEKFIQVLCQFSCCWLALLILKIFICIMYKISYFKGIYVCVFKILSAYICAHRLDVGFAKTAIIGAIGAIWYLKGCGREMSDLRRALQTCIAHLHNPSLICLPLHSLFGVWFLSVFKSCTHIWIWYFIPPCITCFPSSTIFLCFYP